MVCGRYLCEDTFEIGNIIDNLLSKLDIFTDYKNYDLNSIEGDVNYELV